MESLIYIANVLYLLSYFVQDMLRLRVLTVVAATLLVCYFYFQPEPMMTVVYWNVFFIALNLVQLARLLLRRRAETGFARDGIPGAVHRPPKAIG